MAAPTDFFAGVVGKVTFVNKWPLLLKATQDDVTPTPGYLYKEIADLSYESTSNCQCLVDFLADRLEKNSSHIKFKVLKVMLHVVEHGHPYFSEGLRRKAQGIQAAAKYSGPPDPLHGMAPYVAVRKTANALSEKLFDTENTPSRDGSNLWSKSGHMTHGTMTTSQGSRKMEGVGNSPIITPKPVTIESLSQSVIGGLQQIANKLGGENKGVAGITPSQANAGYKPLHGYDPASSYSPHSGRQGLATGQASHWSQTRTTPQDYSPVLLDNHDDDDDDDDDHHHASFRDESLPFSPSHRASASASKSRSSFDRNHRAETAGGVSVSVDVSQKENRDEAAKLIDVLSSAASRGGQSSDSKGSDQLSAGSSDLAERLESVSVADWTEEVATIEAFVSSHQQRATPTKNELQQFVKRSSLLNCVKAIELLASHLSLSSPITHLRCLFGIEGILKEDFVSSDVALRLLTSPLTSAQSSQDKAVRAKASKILRQLERLEADTNLDQPLMSDSQRLIMSHAGEDAPRPQTTGDHLAPTRSPATSYKHIGSLQTTASLFSGMTLSGHSAPSSPSLLLQTSNGGSSSPHAAAPPPVTQGSMGEKWASPDLLLGTGTVVGAQPSTLNTDLLLGNAAAGVTPSHNSSTKQTGSMNSGGLSNGNSSNANMPLPDVAPQEQSRLDPIMSRGAGFADLWGAVSPGQSAASLASSRTQANTLSGNTIMTSSQPYVTSQNSHMISPNPSLVMSHDISQLYPQLSSATLSGASAMPINLTKKPVTGFGFVGGDEERANAKTRGDAFSFVQDAMKMSKK